MERCIHRSRNCIAGRALKEILFFLKLAGCFSPIFSKLALRYVSWLLIATRHGYASNLIQRANNRNLVLSTVQHNPSYAYHSCTFSAQSSFGYNISFPHCCMIAVQEAISDLSHAITSSSMCQRRVAIQHVK